MKVDPDGAVLLSRRVAVLARSLAALEPKVAPLRRDVQCPELFQIVLRMCERARA